MEQPVIALETTVPKATAALLYNGKIAQVTIAESFPHAEYVIPAIDTLLSDNGIRPENIGEVIVDKGPGSFTGIRLGLSVAMGLAAPWGIHVRACTAPAAAAWSAVQKGCNEPYIAVIQDAKTRQVYLTLFTIKDTGMHQVSDTTVLETAALKENLKPETAVIGDRAFLEFIMPDFDAQRVMPFEEHITASSLLDIYRSCEAFVSEDLSPVYLKSPVHR